MGAAALLENESIELLMDRKQTGQEFGGVCDKVFGTVNDKKVLIKSYKKTRMDSFAELFAYRLGTRLGLKVNKIKLVNCGTLLGLEHDFCSVHFLEDEFKTKCDLNYNAISSDDEDLVNIFDTIINNDDRHSSNYGKIGDELFLIDHGYSRPWRLNVDTSKLRVKSSNKLIQLMNTFINITDKEFEEMIKIPEEFSNIELGVNLNLIIERMHIVQDTIKETDNFYNMNKGFKKRQINHELTCRPINSYYSSTNYDDSTS